MKVTFPHVGMGQRRQGQPSMCHGPVRSPGGRLSKIDPKASWRMPSTQHSEHTLQFGGLAPRLYAIAKKQAQKKQDHLLGLM